MYNPQEIEKKWQKRWQEEKVFEAEDFCEKPKHYILVEFPYPSGEGLHVGHCRSYVAQDVLARYKRMKGENVLFPIGWDAFGLPAENYAIKHKIKPQDAVAENIATFKAQIQSLGISFDWSREVNTTDPKYYKWTQWIFAQFYKEGLAYKKEMPINWCPSCKIGLANEEVVNGGCERCGHEVSKKNLNQWMLKITEYAEKLLEGLDEVEYLPEIKAQQKNWIGKSVGANIDFEIENKKVTVFTTRPDTLFGVTYLVLAPENELVSEMTTDEQRSIVESYQKEVASKSDRERQMDQTKTGVFTGAYAKHPITGENLPVWVADYVLASVGTGAVMAVPAHDDRDWEFAQKFELPQLTVLKPNSLDSFSLQEDTLEKDTDKKKEIFDTLSKGMYEGCYMGEGIVLNSDFLNDLTTQEAKQKMISWLEENNKGEGTTTYKLRDWVFSRQHYWGEPIPIVFCKECGEVVVPEEQLPIMLPDVDSYEPTDTGESPLAKITDWVNTECPKCGGPAERETDTMPNWAGSSWYFLRYIDTENEETFADPEKLKYWLQVDHYNGGMEHVTLHLLYSRFWHRFLYDIGKVPTKEPYNKRIAHGMILAEDGVKMSKSKGNTVNPNTTVEEFGADVLRTYEMFIGPYDQTAYWSESSIRGISRFLKRVHAIPRELDWAEKDSEDVLVSLNKMIKGVGDDIERRFYNTAVSKLMIFVNDIYENGKLTKNAFKDFLKVGNVFFPHLAQELWNELGEDSLLCQVQWPVYDAAYLQESEIEFVIQVNSKVRAKIKVSPDISEEDAVEVSKQDPNIQKYLEGKEIKKIIFIKGRLVNFVIG